MIQHILGYQVVWIIDIGLKAGLFRALAEAGEGGLSARGLAQVSGCAERYVEV